MDEKIQGLVTGLPDKINSAKDSIIESRREDNRVLAGAAAGILLGGLLQQIGEFNHSFCCVAESLLH